MKKLILVKKDNDSYYFSNPNTGSENEVFENKLEGTTILLEYLGESEFISRKNHNKETKGCTMGRS